jgi:predicted RNase H-like nuclease (RuvC/YqgF family)
MSVDAGDIVSVVVAVVAGLFAWASQRSASSASKTNTATVTAVDREKEAYERARAFDTETIRRQDEELAELREDNRKLHDRVTAAEGEAREARAEAAEAKRESQEVRAENIRLRSALEEFVRNRDRHLND